VLEEAGIEAMIITVFKAVKVCYWFGHQIQVVLMSVILKRR